MRLAILSRKSSLYTTRRLIEAAEKQGHQAVVLDPLHCLLSVEGAEASLSHRGKRNLEGLAAVIPRIGSSITEYGLAVVRHFELMGIPSVNSPQAIASSRDKLRAVQLLSRAGIAQPATVLLRNMGDLEDALKRVGGLPVVVKLSKGTQGIGVMLAEHRPGLESLLETLWGLGQNIMLQAYIRESAGRDIRVIVVGGRILGAMERIAKPGEFRSNIHRGGEARAFDLPINYASAALGAMRATGLEVGGVDLMETAAGPLVLEANSSPGFEGFDEATGVDTAGAIIEFAAGLAARRGDAV